ncbi:MAG TPA: metal ABC transporter substrate-binding protein [Gemmatimonadaceae bacterium]
MHTLLLSLLTAATTHVTTPPFEGVKVVTSLTTYGAIAREVVGDKGTVTSIAQGDEDPHFVQPRPSFVPLLRDADLFVWTGMDLELWVGTLLDRAGNSKIREGGPGSVLAKDGITILEIPTSLSRSQGDIHVDGNPHIHSDPVSAIFIARNVLAGLKRVDAKDADYFTAREKDFEDRIITATFGADLVKIVTAPTLFQLANSNKIIPFLQNTKYQGAPLINKMGGWMKTLLPYRGQDMVCYHKEWAYFSNRYGINCIEYIEAKPGIPPTPKHVQDVINLMREKHIPVLFASNYFDHGQIRDVATKTGATAVIVPENTNGAPGINTYFDLMNMWVTDLAKGFASGGTK